MKSTVQVADTPAATIKAQSLGKYYFAQGGAMLARGKLSDAIQQYVKALDINPDWPEALCNLGIALTRLGGEQSLKTALTCFDRALALAPDFALAHNNRGAALEKSQRADEALLAYREAMSSEPRYIESHLNFAALLLRLGRTNDAIARYRIVLDLDSRNVAARQALISLSDLMQADGRGSEAAATCTIVARRNPRDAEARVKLAFSYPIILDSAQSGREVRARLLNSLEQLSAQGFRVDDPFRQLCRTNFYFAYQGLDDLELQKTIARFHLAACPALDWIAPHCRRPQPHGGERLRLGIVCEYLDGHTIGKLYRGLVRELARDRRFEVILMRPNRAIDAATGAIDALAARVVEYPRSLFDARRAIAAERCDVLFYPEIGMDELTYYLAFARLAPVQCVSWGHPVTTGIAAIDYFISARDLEPDNADSHYSERLVRLASPPTCYSRPSRPDPRLDRASLGIPPDATLYLCPQSLFKIHPDFDAALAAILREDPRARIVMLAGSRPHWMQLLRARFERNIPNAGERILFVPPLRQSEFFQLLLAADVMLDPFHFGGGNSTYEALGLGVPIVTMPGAFMRGRVTYACYKRMALMDLIASDLSSYVRLAVRVANDRAWRQSLSAEIQKRSGVLFEDTGAIKELGDFLVSAYELASTRIIARSTQLPFEADSDHA